MFNLFVLTARHGRPVSATVKRSVAASLHFDTAIEMQRPDERPEPFAPVACFEGIARTVAIHKQLSNAVLDRIIRDLADKLTHRIRRLFSILRSNGSAPFGDSEKAPVFQWRKSERKPNMNKRMSISWTAVDGVIYEFRAHDRSHPRTAEIYAEVDRVMREVVGQGYKYDRSWISRPIGSHETVESILNGHSERLAIAFNLIQRPAPSFIQVTNNIRMCVDCHTAIKLISRVRNCEIVISDANRIHRFIDGECSCRDYF